MSNVTDLPARKSDAATPPASEGAGVLETRAAGGGAVKNETTKPNPATQPTSLYFVNPWVDFGIIGGVSIVTYIWFRLFHEGTSTATTVLLSTNLLWICNHPHFSATNYRLYHSRDNIMQYPITALVVPWLILAAVVGSFLAPVIVAPYFVKLFTIWSPYHFSGQSLGISLIYARRAGFRVGTWERRGLSAFIFGTFLVTTARAEVSPMGNEYWGIKYPGIGIPAWLPTVLEIAMWVGGAIFLVQAVRWSYKNGRLLAPIILLPAAAQYVWFVASSNSTGFQEFVPFFHSLQYLLIAWSMQLKEKMDQQHIDPSRRYVLSESARWGVINFIGGALLFVVFPYIGVFIAGVTLAFATGITAAAVQIHHFFVDGVIWKLKRKTVASPLMVNIEDMIHPAGKAA